MVSVDDFEYEVDPEYFLRARVDIDTFTGLLEATRGIDDAAVRTVGGTALDGYAAIAEEYEERLHDISPMLDYSLLFPENYWRPGSGSIYRRWISENPDVPRLTLEALKYERGMALEIFGRTLVEQTPDNFEPIQFDDSPYVPSNGKKTQCAIGSFLMPFCALTQTGVPVFAAALGLERAMMREGKLSVSTKHIPDTDMLKIFMTDVFKALLPSNVGVEPIQFAGFTVSDLGRLVSAIRNRMPEAQVRSVLTILSNNSSSTEGILHQIVPIEIAPNRTIAHDTADYGGPYQKFKTERLLQQWYQAQGHGYLVVSRPTQR